MSKLENSMSLKALRAVATQLQNKADATKSRADKREFLAQKRDVEARIAEIESKGAGVKTVAKHLSQIALKAHRTRVANLLAQAKGARKAELELKLAEIDARLPVAA
jgi:hypothetical protein